MKRAIFLDRDGVINVEKNYLYKIEDFKFIDGIFDACLYYQSQNYLIIVVTNQAGIARELYTEKDYQILTKWMLYQFKKRGIQITKVYHCPHHPKFTGACSCRKPNAGMLIKASKDYGISLKSSILIGDKLSDMMAAKNAKIGCKVLVKSGHNIRASNYKYADMVIDSISDFKLIPCMRP